MLAFVLRRPPSALPATRLGKGGFAPFTPTKEETQLTDKPKFENPLYKSVQMWYTELNQKRRILPCSDTPLTANLTCLPAPSV